MSTSCDPLDEDAPAYSNSRRSCANRKRPKSPPTTRFKGVVPQISGHWGAQIYANHQRIWLGTFKSETEAAMAYDSASIKLRSGDSHRNFPWSPVSMQEPVFQKHYTTEAVLSMIKDGSYPSKFSEFVEHQQRMQSADQAYTNNHSDAAGSLFCDNNNMTMMMMKTRLGGMEKFSCKKLFRKELTPSDVGKLNRLVIPKKFAVKFFPGIMFPDADQGEDKDDVLLSFYDPLVRLWKFRYSYWKSSQSFVFTRGWSRFVKEKELKAKDVVTFFVCEGHQAKECNINSDPKPSTFYLIDVTYFDAQSNEDKNIMKKNDDEQESIQVDAEENENGKTSSGSSEVADEKEAEQSADKKMCFRLFGVDIQN